MCDPEAAKDNEDLPVKLNDAKNLSKFIENVLPGVLEEMKEAHPAFRERSCMTRRRTWHRHYMIA